jgi:hypothetical protein
MRESSPPLKNGIPAFAGMTNGVVFDLKKIKFIGKQYDVKPVFTTDLVRFSASSPPRRSTHELQ